MARIRSVAIFWLGEKAAKGVQPLEKWRHDVKTGYCQPWVMRSGSPSMTLKSFSGGIPDLDDLSNFDGGFVLGLSTLGRFRRSGGRSFALLCSAVRTHGLVSALCSLPHTICTAHSSLPIDPHHPFNQAG
jgi:hypothetical protein